MDYTAMTTVTQTTLYHVEALDTESGEWTRVQPAEFNEFYDGEDGFVHEIKAMAYAANVRYFSGGAKVQIVEEITMRARRVVMEQ